MIYCTILHNIVCIKNKIECLSFKRKVLSGKVLGTNRYALNVQNIPNLKVQTLTLKVQNTLLNIKLKKPTIKVHNIYTTIKVHNTSATIKVKTPK